MKNIIFILLFSQLLLGEHLVISSTPTGAISRDVIVVNSILKSFEQSFTIGDGTHITEIPLYMNSDSSNTVRLRISNLSALLNGEESIGVRLYYRNLNGSYIQLHEGDAVIVQGSRDGESIVGYIKIETDSIADTQTFGDYRLLGNITVGLGDRWSSSATLEVKANVSLVAVAGLRPTNSNRVGEKFISSTVKFNNLSFDVNRLEQPLYVKSNSNNLFKITFNNTPDLLLNGVDNKSKIKMRYYYKKRSNSYHKIVARESFDAIIGKNSGSTPIGTLQFETEKVKDTTMAGEYSNSVSVSVYAQ
jgi:hypothetical protein